MGRFHWPRRLRRRSAAARLLRLWVRIPHRTVWMSACCECCELSGRGLCEGLITHPEEPYRMLYVVVCDLETSWMRRVWPNGGCCAPSPQKKARVTKVTISYVMMLLLHVTAPTDHLQGGHLQRKDQGVYSVLVWLGQPSHRRSKRSFFNIILNHPFVYSCITDKNMTSNTTL